MSSVLACGATVRYAQRPSAGVRVHEPLGAARRRRVGEPSRRREPAGDRPRVRAMERQVAVRGAREPERHLPAGGKPDAVDVARVLVRVHPAADPDRLLRDGGQRRCLAEVAVAVRVDLLDVVVRLVRILDRRRERERRLDVQHPEARRRVASRLIDVARRAAEDLGELSSVELGAGRPDPGGRARDEGRGEARPGGWPPVLADRARDEDRVTGRRDVDIRRSGSRTP